MLCADHQNWSQPSSQAACPLTRCLFVARRVKKLIQPIIDQKLTCKASLMPRPITKVLTPLLTTSSRSAGCTPGECYVLMGKKKEKSYSLQAENVEQPKLSLRMLYRVLY